MADSAGGVGANQQQIDNARNACYQWKGSFDKIAGEVNAETNALLVTWSGGPSTNFRNAMMRWDEEVAKITQALGNMGGLLETTNVVYGKSQQEAGDAVVTTTNAGLAGFYGGKN